MPGEAAHVLHVHARARAARFFLFWIAKSENHPHSFITKRVKKICESTRLRAATWKYVTITDQNPADILYRGATLKEFKLSNICRNGPS